MILQHIFEHNQAEFTRKDPRGVPVIAVIEEAQSVLGSSAGPGEGPFVSWVKEGRKYDLGAVIVTQQPGSIPAEILSQGDNWFVFYLGRRLKDALDEAAVASGGQPVTASRTVDAAETFARAAIRRLARDEQFQAAVRAGRGIKWGLVQHKLADYLPETFSRDHQERFDWVHQHRLVKRALDEILGDDGWRSGTRDGSQWILATTAARPGPAGQPASS